MVLIDFLISWILGKHLARFWSLVDFCLNLAQPIGRGRHLALMFFILVWVLWAKLDGLKSYPSYPCLTSISSPFSSSFTSCSDYSTEILISLGLFCFQMAWCLVFILNFWIFSRISVTFSRSFWSKLKIKEHRIYLSSRASSWTCPPQFPPSYAMLNILSSDYNFKGFCLFFMTRRLSRFRTLNNTFLISP